MAARARKERGSSSSIPAKPTRVTLGVNVMGRAGIPPTTALVGEYVKGMRDRYAKHVSRWLPKHTQRLPELKCETKTRIQFALKLELLLLCALCLL